MFQGALPKHCPTKSKRGTFFGGDAGGCGRRGLGNGGRPLGHPGRHVDAACRAGLALQRAGTAGRPCGGCSGRLHHPLHRGHSGDGHLGTPAGRVHSLSKAGCQARLDNNHNLKLAPRFSRNDVIQVSCCRRPGSWQLCSSGSVCGRRPFSYRSLPSLTIDGSFGNRESRCPDGGNTCELVYFYNQSPGSPTA